MTEENIRAELKAALSGQLFAVLSTHGSSGPPHSTIVCFTAADELASILFVTPRASRKYNLLTQRPEATLFIDDRRDDLKELDKIRGIEARGRVSELAPDDLELYRQLFLRKFPNLAGFVDAPSSAWFLLAVESYDVVWRFQQVLQYRPGGEP